MKEIAIYDKVEKHELLIKSNYRLKPVASKLVTTLISSVQHKDKPDQEYIIDIQEFVNMAQLTDKNYYDKIYEAITEILSNPVTISQKGSKDYLVTNWCSSAEYNSKENILKFTINSKLFPYLIKLKEKYLNYNIKNILRLSTSYNIRLYEILKDEYNKNGRYKKKTELILPLNELREILIIPKAYTYDHIKKRIINKAQKDFIKDTDIKFDWKPKKRGHSVYSLIITIYPNTAEFKKDTKLPAYLATKMKYINYLRSLYADTGYSFLCINTELRKISCSHHFIINNKNLVEAVNPDGEHWIIGTKQAEMILNSSWLCNIHNESYRVQIEETTDFFEMQKDVSKLFEIIFESNMNILLEHQQNKKADKNV